MDDVVTSATVAYLALGEPTTVQQHLLLCISKPSRDRSSHCRSTAV